MKLWHGADYNHEQWLDRPEVLEADFDAMEKASCNVMAVGIFSWSKYEPREGDYHFEWLDALLDRLHARGIGALLATPSGSKPAWLSETYPSSRIMGPDGRRELHGGRHNHCRSSRDYRGKVVHINTMLAQRYGGHPAVKLWHVSNEYGASRCYCPECLEAFRTWLQRRYGTLAALNQAWWTDFWSHRYTSWDQIVPTDASVTGQQLDWARFTSDQTIDFYLAESAPLRRFAPHIPVTTNFHGPDVGLDYFAFAPHVDVVAWDCYPRWHADGEDGLVAARTSFHHDLFRSLKRRSFLMMESTPSQTNWQGVSPLKRPGLHELTAVQALACGSDSVQYFQWRQSRGGEETYHGSVLRADGGTDSRVFADVARVGQLLAGWDEVAGTPVKTDIAVVLDLPSHWALGLTQLPRNQGKDYWETVRRHHTALGRRGLAADVVDSTADWSAYRLIVAPMLYLLRPGVADRLKAWVDAGGILVTGYLTGRADEAALIFKTGPLGPLADLAGLRVDELDAVADHQVQGLRTAEGTTGRVRQFAELITPTTAAVKGVYTDDFYAGQPALTVNSWGRGQVWYLAARTDDAFLEAFLADRAVDAGLVLPTPTALPEGVQVRRRGEPGRERTWAMNFEAEPAVFRWEGAEVRLAGRSWALLTGTP